MNRDMGSMSGFEESGIDKQNQDFPRPGYGQSYPQHYSQATGPERDPLGAPLTIREAARLIGCSAWTVRHKYIPRGLPCLRSGPSGKLIFYRDQVVAWILTQQKKGGRT